MLLLVTTWGGGFLRLVNLDEIVLVEDFVGDVTEKPIRSTLVLRSGREIQAEQTAQEIGTQIVDLQRAAPTSALGG